MEYEIDPAELGLEKARPVGKVCRSCNVIYQLLFVRFKLQEDKKLCTKKHSCQHVNKHLPIHYILFFVLFYHAHLTGAVYFVCTCECGLTLSLRFAMGRVHLERSK